MNYTSSRDRLTLSRAGQNAVNSQSSYSKGQSNMQEFVLQSAVNGTEDEKINELSAFQKNLQLYGKGYKDDKGNFQLQSVQEYYNERDSKLKGSVLSDLTGIRQEYIRRGGQNPEFLNNLTNIEEYMNGKDKAGKNINNPSALMAQRGTEELSKSNTYNHSDTIQVSSLQESFKHELLNFSILHNENQMNLPVYQRRLLGSLDNSSIAGSQSPEKGLMGLLNVQESELLLDMSKLQPDTLEYEETKDKYKKIKVLKQNLAQTMIANSITHSLSGYPLSDTQGVMRQKMLNDQSLQATVPGGYTKIEGFVLRIDYASFIPPHFDEVKAVYGIFKKSASFDPYLQTYLHNAEYETSLASKCMFLEKKRITNVIPSYDQILYFELRANEKGPLNRKLILRSWTMHQIFDINKQLVPGRFRLPFYNKNLNPHLLEATGLPSIEFSSLFIRVCLPDDPFLDNESYVFVENEYKTPSYHQRSQLDLQKTPNMSQPLDPVFLRNAREEKAKAQEEELNRLIQLQKNKDAGLPLVKKNNDAGAQGAQITNPTERTITQKSGTIVPNRGLTPSQRVMTASQIGSQKRIPTQQLSNVSAVIPSEQSQVYLLDGVLIQIVSLEKNTTEKQGCKLELKIFDNNVILQDSSDKPCENTFQLFLEKGITHIGYEKKFDVQVKAILAKYKKLQLEKMFVFINFLDKDNTSVGWIVAPLFKTSFKGSQLNNGRFIEFLFKPPAKKPPFSRVNLKSDLIIEYIIHDPDLLDTEVNTFNNTAPPKSAITSQKPSGSINSNNDSPVRPKSSKLTHSTRSFHSEAQSPGIVTDININQQDKITSVDGPRNALILEIIQVKNYTNKLSVSFDLVIIKGNEMVNDEFGYSTIYHCEELVSPLANQDFILLSSIIKIPLDLERVLQKKLPKYETCHVLFKILEIDENDNENILGWFAHPLFKNGKPNTGKFMEGIYDSPMQTEVPLVKAQIKLRKEKLQYNVNLQKMQAPEYNKLCRISEDPAIDAKSSQQISQKSININPRNDDDPREKYNALLIEVKNLEKPINLQVRSALVEGDHFLVDDVNDEATFQGDLKQSDKNNIMFMEEYNFDVNITKLAERDKNSLNEIFLVFYFLTAENEPKYWYFFKVFKENSQPKFDTFQAKLYLAPFQRVDSIDKKKLKESKAVIRFATFKGLPNSSAQ